MTLKWIYLKRFLNTVLISKVTNCWEWQGRPNAGGYGVMRIGDRFILAHRLAWMIHTHADVPNRMEVCHECDNPICVNPNHLFLSTHLANMKDMVKRKRSVHRYGSKNPNSKLSERQVKKIKTNLAAGGSRKEMADKFKVHLSTIDRIANNIQWKHV